MIRYGNGWKPCGFGMNSLAGMDDSLREGWIPLELSGCKAYIF